MDDQRGNAPLLEMVLMTPVLVVILLLVVGLGRMAETRQQVESIASDAARAASLERDRAQSAAAARAAAVASADRSGLLCVGLDVDVDLAHYEPGGAITVTVSCSARLGDLTATGLPGSHVFSATSTVPIETYRGS
ncbi:TadE/TadG family type IV pilus assembly protein [Nocardioides zeae]|uniref:TadE/TadG family type IV pilus assembly protein n=1 Tax=Nocardioides imazamoxiresistens TaxID=3231893 RepID=A0ABU3Q1I4_9ACTN|nr:TadE/TadG family type IV pilus assembly protein [Nocardioides zeae]